MPFRVNAPDVIQETIEGEVIIIHLLTGSYYSLLGTGAIIWAGIVGGLDQQAIACQFAAPEGSDPAAVSSAIASFLDELVQEGLIVPAEAPAHSPAPAAGCVPFVAPSLQKYRDMEELLLLDPIHQVDPAGWPAPKDDPPADGGSNR
jgi:hypothetical protein